jgi:hypothetical protein
VPRDGTIDEAAKKFGFMRPLKLYAFDREAFATWVEACYRVYSLDNGQTYYPFGEISDARLRVEPGRYASVTEGVITEALLRGHV